MNSLSLSTAELRAVTALAGVFFLRMLPLFMLLPVLSLAGNNYTDASPQLMGIALGIYGLTQALLQIPFGLLSDRYGRKKMITVGLTIFILGSILAALSTSVYGLILGRALQGGGAIAAAIMALTADLTRAEVRTKAMAFIGISIGVAFSLAFVIGPLLYAKIALSGLFYLGALLGLLAMICLWWKVPNPDRKVESAGINLQGIIVALSNFSLLRLNVSIFISHTVLMANFVVIPITLRDFAHMPSGSHWQIYLGVILASLLIMVPLIMLSGRLAKTKLCLLISVGLISISQLGYALLHEQLWCLIIFMVLFFGAFNFLEALLPSEVSKTAVAEYKGASLGLYSTSQFIGIFIGGLVGGFLHQHVGITAVHLGCLAMACIWFLVVGFTPQKLQADQNKLEEEPV